MRALCCCLLFVLCISVPVRADILNVPGAFDRIQDAIDAAVSGDIVRVAAGTYNESIDFLGKAITVESEQGSAYTVIRGGGASTVVTFQSGEGLSSRLEGFTVTNGYSSGEGGGILCRNSSSPTLRHNVVKGNVSSRGGGILCLSGSAPLIKDNTVTDNVALHTGGGICCEYAAAILIQGNLISKNRADEGAGICCTDSVSLQILENTISENDALQDGGG